MVVHGDDGDALAPDIEHGTVDYVGERTLRIVGNCFP